MDCIELSISATIKKMNSISELKKALLKNKASGVSLRNKLNNRQLAIVVMFIFGIVGVGMLLATQAASPSISIEAEKGLLAGASCIVSGDSDASGGSTVKFGNCSSSETAVLRGWGAVVSGDEFNYSGAPDAQKWSVYDSPGHAGNGLRKPSAITVSNGALRIDGDAQGTTGGMSAKFDKGLGKYGRWESRMRTSIRDPQYHPVMILWPDSNNWPCDGEIDFAEGTKDTTQIGFYNHYSCSNQQTTAKRVIDTTQWHNYAVEWSESAVIGYIDGVEWFRDENSAHQPPGTMHQTIQLDWFPGDGSGAPKPSWLEVDWARYYGKPNSNPNPPQGGAIKLASVADPQTKGTIDSSEGKRGQKVASAINSWNPDIVTVSGDFNDSSSCNTLVNVFDKLGYGSLKSKLIGTAGPTHDFNSSMTAPEWGKYMEGTCSGQTSGPSLSATKWGRDIQPYEPHWVDVGAWTIISLPSAQWRSEYSTKFGNQWTGSAINTWLDDTLKQAQSRGDHVLAIFHEPYWTSGTSSHSETEGDNLKPWMQTLYNYKVPLVISGHQHSYERFYPQNPNGDIREDSRGVQQFQVSIGGIGQRTYTTTAKNSAVKADANNATWGYVQFLLNSDGSYDWELKNIEGSFTDKGHRDAIK